MAVSAPNLSIPDLEIRIQLGFKVVECRLRKAASGSRDLVDQLASHFALTGSKRLHPVLILVCAQLGGPTRTLDEAVITGATAVELTHLASLYHDDVMDSTSVCRGVPSAQHLWGNNRAILAGSVLLAHASVLIAALGPEMVSHHTRTFERLCIGQLNETFGPGEGQDRVDLYIKTLADKTESLVATIAHSGAWLSGAGKEVVAIASGLGKRIGVTFQIASDAIDLTSGGDTPGKTLGTGLREGVDTPPVLLFRRHLVQNMIDEDERHIPEALDSDLSSNEVLAELVVALRHHEVLEETRQMAKDWSMRAIKTLEPLPEGEAKTALIAFAHLMVDRLA